MSDLEAAYAVHPLNAKSILDRVKREGKRIGEVTEDDFAVDAATEITDQNHVGGIHAAVEAALLLEATPHAHFLDIGCGLGGTARVAADRFGCHVHGVEIVPARYRDAQPLTELVHLQDRVSFVCGDFMNVALAAQQYDGALSQGSIVHIHDLEGFFDRCGFILKSGRRLVVEDVCLGTNPLHSSNKQMLAELERIWSAKIVSPERWLACAAAARFEVLSNEDLSLTFSAYFRQLVEISGRMRPPLPRSELASWELARDLSELKGAGISPLDFFVLPKPACMSRDILALPTRRSRRDAPGYGGAAQLDELLLAYEAALRENEITALGWSEAALWCNHTTPTARRPSPGPNNDVP